MSNNSNIVVIGSINMDIINRVERHPVVGETIKALHTQYSPGGKGANQAVAAALAGAHVTFIGAVGTDVFGPELKSTIVDFGVEAKNIVEKNGASGLAFITVNEAGKNHIILSAGANGKLTIDDVPSLTNILSAADLVLLQNEIPWLTNQLVMIEANKHRVPVVFNPAPALQIPYGVLPLIDVLILNESEAQMITGVQVTDFAHAEEAGKWLLAKGVKSIIVTLGEKGSLYLNQMETFVVPAFKVDTLDTTAAGDTFIGAFSVGKSAGLPVEQCLRFATAAAALSVTRHGALSSIPSLTEIESFLDQNT